MSDKPIHKQLAAIEKVERNLSIKKSLLVEQAMTSSLDPNDLIKANSILNVDERNQVNRKAYIIDPYEFQSFLGYKDRPYSLSYSMLKRMSYTVPIIRSIINTRIDQIATFCEPQKNKYSAGFVIKKKRKHFYNDVEEELTDEDKRTIEKITDFLLNCGVNNGFEADDFDSFVRKIMNDSLTYDQMTFEIVHDRRGRPIEFYATDASTIRISDSFDTNDYDKSNRKNNNTSREKVMGYYPAYCQIENGIIHADFYPWEMCFGVRNPTTNIYANGYGVSEPEMLMNVITSMLWSDEYNRRFFSQGSAPKGFFKIKPGTNINDGKLAQFKQQYQQMMAGVYNSHKTAVFEGDIDWVDLQHNNRDMEFSHWQEYLIKLSCAIYKIDPAEINFPLSGSSDQKPMFEGNNEARLKHSKDKGLYPMLKFLERKINKYLVQRINPEYVFEFTGLQIESASEELDRDIKMMSNFMTVDEIRKKYGLELLGEDKGGNVIANSVVYQAMMAKQQEKMAQQQEQQGGQEEGEDQYNGEGEDQYNEEGGGSEEENPFEKAFNNYVLTL